MTTNKTRMLIQLGILQYKHETFGNFGHDYENNMEFKPALILHNSNTHLLILLKVLNRVI